MWTGQCSTHWPCPSCPCPLGQCAQREIDLFACLFVLFPAALFVAVGDVARDLGHRLGVGDGDDDRAIAIGDNDVARENAHATAGDRDVFGVLFEPSRADAACDAARIDGYALHNQLVRVPAPAIGDCAARPGIDPALGVV